MTDLPLPLPQSPEYARACAVLGITCRVGEDMLPGAAALRWQLQTRRLPLVGTVSLLSRGPVAAQPADAESWLREWRMAEPLVLNADGLSGAALRRAGFWPLLTPATLALVPLGPETEMRAALRQKWRNRLARGARGNLALRRMPLQGAHWLLGAEAAQARARRYRNLPPAFLAAFAKANPGAALIWEARQGGTPVAAIAVLRHGRMASWTTGVATAQGRAANAMPLLLWEAMRWLAARGHDQLDLGILNDDDAPGVTRFKLGTGARPHRLGGTWLRCRALAPLARHLPKGLAT
ncbi:GNAT family N-acetyltransferase [Salipiger pacificus]|uniref:GNAT family N-acetyltransferase n=2 Tax=Salipiger mangrovisoli TaxID=2865933 RepID=A0ABR9WWR5_9RHOB|nr:GNAT family N-acetyltransferase [Salipiger mangrovisoli]